jgi:hypothetical protein
VIVPLRVSISKEGRSVGSCTGSADQSTGSPVAEAWGQEKAK